VKTFEVKKPTQAMPLTLYFSTPSGPARSVLLLARYLKLDIEVKHINLGAGEQHDPEFLKINPLHKVPVLVDGDYILPESRAILAYLVNSRQPGSDLYPSDAKARGIVDRMLYYDAGNCYDRLSNIVVRLCLCN
jgi:glutathione S-transferase